MPRSAPSPLKALSSRKSGPPREGWIHEIKYDGYRTLIVIDGGQVRAFTRNGNDWTRAGCGARLACETALIDGEIASRMSTA